MGADAGFPGDGPVLVLSPHLDDVPLSCFHLVARRAPITVLHVCSTGPVPAVAGDWDRRAGFVDSDAAMAARRAEERAAFAGTPHELRDLGLLDAQYGGTLDGTARDQIAAAVLDWVRDTGGGTVVAPVGAGCEPRSLVPLARLRNLRTGDQLFWKHPDHLATRDACVTALRGRTDVDLVLYEDFPYLRTTRGDAAARATRARFGAGAALERVEVAVDREAKARCLLAYTTQLPLMLPAHATTAPGLERYLPTTERYWRVRRG